MADYTISSGDYIKPYKSAFGPCKEGSVRESTGQSFIYGDVLELDDAVSTSIHRATRASTTGSTCNSTSIIGVAAAHASSVVDTRIPYYTADPDNEFIGRTRGGTLAASNVGSAFGLFRDSSKNVWLVDLGNTQSTSLRVMVTDLVDDIGDSGGRVIFKFGCPKGSTNTFGLQTA